MNLDDEAIDRALHTWNQEGDVAYSARVGDYLHPGMSSSRRDEAMAQLGAADEEAWQRNRDLMRRAILSALEPEAHR